MCTFIWHLVRGCLSLDVIGLSWIKYVRYMLYCLQTLNLVLTLNSNRNLLYSPVPDKIIYLPFTKYVPIDNSNNLAIVMQSKRNISFID